MDVGDQLHVPAALPPAKAAQLPIEGWAETRTVLDVSK